MAGVAYYTIAGQKVGGHYVCYYPSIHTIPFARERRTGKDS